MSANHQSGVTRSILDPAPLTRRTLLLGAAATATTALMNACGGSSATDTPKPAAPTVAPTPTTGITPSPTVAPIATVTAASAATATPAATASVAVATVGTTLATPTGAPTTPLIVFVGGSQTSGINVKPTDTYPAQLITLLAPTKYDAVNLGASTRTAAVWTSLAPTRIDTLFAASRSKNIVVLWGGGADLEQGATADEAYTNVATFCQGRRGVGFKVVVVTLLPQRSYVKEGTDWEALRGAFNASIRKNLGSFADALADVGADPTLGTADATTNTDYYQSDGTNLWRKGHSIVAEIVKTAILSL